MVGLHPYAIVEKSKESNKKGGDPEDIFFKSDTISHLGSASYQILCQVMCLVLEIQR